MVSKYGIVAVIMAGVMIDLYWLGVSRGGENSS